MIIQRDILQKLKPFLKRKEFIAIVGPRQSGKTTLLRLLKDYLSNKLGLSEKAIQIATFEDRMLLAQFERDPIAFIASYQSLAGTKKFYFMIDEFQYAEDGGQKLKFIYDTVAGIKIFITGSSSLDIKAKVGKYMVGRIFNFVLFPFNFGEYLQANDERAAKIYKEYNEQIKKWLLWGQRYKITKSGKDVFGEDFIKKYEKFCIWGGYPAAVLAKTDIERKKILSDIYSNYILKDIKSLLELATEKNLFLLSQYLATQISNIAVYQNLSQASGLDYRNLKKHLNILEETFICKTVKPFFKNRQKELSKNPKIFFMDMGFRNNLMENMGGFEKRPDAGAIAENAVFIRLNELAPDKINFWRTKTGTEVDFVLAGQNSDILPIEVKYANFVSEKIPRGLLRFIDSFGPTRALVLTKDFWGRVKKNGCEILFIPTYYL